MVLNDKFKNLVIVFLVIIILLLLGDFYLIYIGKINFDNNDDVNNNKIIENDSGKEENISNDKALSMWKYFYYRSHSGKEWLNNSYLNYYKMKVKSIFGDLIVYNVKSVYISSDLYVNNPNSECSVSNSSKCTDRDKEYKDTEFIIENNNDNNWVVSDFVLHE